jgi:thymidine phosphorylase
MDAGLIGRACVALGAGRSKATDAIDCAVGVSHITKVGATVRANDPLLTVHARSDEALKIALVLIERAIEIA